MSKAELPIDNSTDNSSEESNFLTKLMQETVETVTHADEQEAVIRVQKLREKSPTATADELAETLIRNKCMQAGAIGAVTASPTMIPGIGTVVALTFGTAVDIGMMYKLQGELVYELIDLYAPDLPSDHKNNVLMIVTGIGIGANRVISQSGQEIAADATSRLASRFSGVASREVAAEVTEDAAAGLLAKSVSTVLGVATAAGINVITTYMIGRRTQAYLKQGPEAMEDWTASLRTVIGVDERKLVAWLMEATRTSWQLIHHQSSNLGTKLAAVGQSAKELYIIQADKTGKRVVEIAGHLADQSDSTLSQLATLGRNAGAGITAGATALVNRVAGKRKLTDDEVAQTSASLPNAFLPDASLSDSAAKQLNETEWADK